MARSYRKYDEDFKRGAVQLVVETGKPIAQVARELANSWESVEIRSVVAG
jgi:transposase-like protein